MEIEVLVPVVLARYVRNKGEIIFRYPHHTSLLVKMETEYVAEIEKKQSKRFYAY